MKKNDRVVFRRGDGRWVNKLAQSSRASSLHTRQFEAENTAKHMLHHQGGGELIVMGRDHRIRSKDTIAPGNDPFPPRDREH